MYTIYLEGDKLIDEDTASRWDPNLLLAISGSVAGKSLQPIPSLSSYDWTWVDFYPESEFFEPQK